MSVKGLIIWTVSIFIGIVFIFYKGKHSGGLEATLEQLKKESKHNARIKKIRKRNIGISKPAFIEWLRKHRDK